MVQALPLNVVIFLVLPHVKTLRFNPPSFVKGYVVTLIKAYKAMEKVAYAVVMCIQEAVTFIVPAQAVRIQEAAAHNA